MKREIDSNYNLTMIRRGLNGIATQPFPAGIGVKWFEAGDENDWVTIQKAADKYNRIDEALFRRQFEPPDELPRRQFFLVLDGKPVATSTAWFNNDFHDGRWGRVHWVAVTPEYQGRGLGKVLLAMTCQRLLELGHSRAYLTSSSARIPALNLYLSFGFEPLIETAEDAAIWRGLRISAKHLPPKGA